MLKTSVFYLTQNHDFDSDNIEKNNRWVWVILIYEKFRYFILKGDVKEFFKDMPIFRASTLNNAEECTHTIEDFTADLPRYICCRRRRARLLIVDRILEVLHVLLDRNLVT